MSTDTTTTKNGSKGHLWGVQIRRELDTLMLARGGEETSHVMFMLAVEAVTADTGTLVDSSGVAGFAWRPSVYTNRRSSKDPAADRIKSAGASLGRIMAGGHPDHRTYLAFMEAVYVVTVAQDYDVASRIEALWDRLDGDRTDIHDIVESIIEDTRKPNPLKRFVAWVKRVLHIGRGG